jgi:hypothetical protein
MKIKILIMGLLMAIAFNFIVGGAVAFATGLNPILFGCIAVLIGVAIGETNAYLKVRGNTLLQRNLLFAGILREIWISQIMEKFYPNNSFLNRAQDMDGDVNNNTINLADAGIDPNVLVNNTSYPVAIVERDDAALALGLKYLDTENTVVRNAIKKQQAYNQMESVIRGHRNSLMAKCANLAAWNWAPQQDGAFQAVKQTSGDDNGSGVKRFKIADLIAQQTVMNLLNVPDDGRVAILNPKHLNDILVEDVAYQKVFANTALGKLPQLYGFDIIVSNHTPKFNSTTGQKTAYGSVDAVTDAPASIFYHQDEVMKAQGTMDMFSRLNDPEARGDIIGFQMFFIGLSIRSKYSSATYSGNVA